MLTKRCKQLSPSAAMDAQGYGVPFSFTQAHPNSESAGADEQ
jgi:hypothetical protein